MDFYPENKTPNQGNIDSNTLHFDFSHFPDEGEINKRISLETIRDEIHSTLQAFQPVPHREVLSKLLSKVMRLDFRELAGLEDEKTSLKKKHYLVSAIEELLSLTKINHWGLCKKHDFVYLYNGAFWNLLSEEEIKNFLGEAGEKMGIDKFDSRHYAFKDQLYRQFLSSAYLPEPHSDKEAVLINLQNGTFEVSPEGRELRNFHPSDFLTYQLSFKHDPLAKAPLFKAYLDKVQPDKQRQDILAEYLGYVFAPHLKLEKTLLLYGTGANGKSVFFDIVNALLGKENVTNFSLQSLTDENGYYRAKLGNYLVNYTSEINGKMETSIFKQLVSGEPVEARNPYGEPFTLKKYARLIFNCNELPSQVEHTHAFFRRFLIVPFDITIPTEEQDRDLAKKIIRSELSGVFNWVLEGLERLLKQNAFTQSEAVSNQLRQYQRESDSVQMFLDEEGFGPSSKESRPLSQLYLSYKIYAMENVYRIVSKKTFSQRLRAIGFLIERKNYGNAIYVEKK